MGFPTWRHHALTARIAPDFKKTKKNYFMKDHLRQKDGWAESPKSEKGKYLFDWSISLHFQQNCSIIHLLMPYQNEK